MQAVIDAAEECATPVFLQACTRVLAHLGARPIALLMREAAERARVPVGIHFDHGPEPTRLLDILGYRGPNSHFLARSTVAPPNRVNLSGFDAQAVPIPCRIVRTQALAAVVMKWVSLATLTN